MEIGKKVLEKDLIDVFKASEGSINMYYGLIGHGKTYSATADILHLLKQGKDVLIDATNYNKKNRKRFLEIAKKHNVQFVAKVLKTI